MNTSVTSDLGLPFEVVPTNLPGVFTSAAALDDFDPRTASDADLIKRGILLRRPRPGDSPVLRAAWDRAFSRVWRAQDRIVPQSEPHIGRTHNLRGAKQVGDGSYTSDNWAGAALPGTWTTAVGYWQIPSVWMSGEPQGSEGGWNSSSWVGIDGAYGSTDVLQAGVQQSVDANGSVSYVAWYEWYTPPQAGSPGYIYETAIPNFPVNPGDTVYCSVQYVANNTAGQIYFANDTTGQYFTITLAPPPGASFSGNCAEWIMEAPDGGEPTSSLPNFTPVTFTSAVCCGPNGAGNPESGDTYTVTAADGTVLTAETVGSDTVTISYTGPTGQALTGGSLACFGVAGGDSRVYYLDAASHMHELAWQNGWGNTDLTAAAGSAPVLGSPLTCFGVGGLQSRVYYLDGASHVHELAWQDGWGDTDLTAAAGSVSASGGTALTCFGVGGLASRVYYLGSDDQVHELSWQDDGWQDATLPGSPDAGSALACYGVDGLYTRTYYLGQLGDGNTYVNELAWENGWVNTPL
jgi:hypothetical protein